MIEAILTIDDISSKNTPVLVDYLNEKGIRAVMFAVGKNVEKYYEQALYALKNGMIVGNHSYSHPAFSALSMEQALEEIEKTESVLDALYRDAGVERKYRPFRFPYGDKGGENKDKLQAYLKSRHFTKLKDTQITAKWYDEQWLHHDVDTYWTYDIGEWAIRPENQVTKEDILARMEEKNPGVGSPLLVQGEKHIILFHAHDETEEMVKNYHEIFLNYAMERGVSFQKPEFDLTFT